MKKLKLKLKDKNFTTEFKIYADGIGSIFQINNYTNKKIFMAFTKEEIKKLKDFLNEK